MSLFCPSSLLFDQSSRPKLLKRSIHKLALLFENRKLFILLNVYVNTNRQCSPINPIRFQKPFLPIEHLFTYVAIAPAMTRSGSGYVAKVTQSNPPNSDCTEKR